MNNLDNLFTKSCHVNFLSRKFAFKVIYQSFHAVFLTLIKTPIALFLSHSLDSNRVIYHLNFSN